MFVQEATTEVIWAYSEAAQAVSSPAAATLVTFAADADVALGDVALVDLTTAELVVFTADELVAFASTADEIQYLPSVN
jgi:hypothetical protein